MLSRRTLVQSFGILGAGALLGGTLGRTQESFAMIKDTNLLSLVNLGNKVIGS